MDCTLFPEGWKEKKLYRLVKRVSSLFLTFLIAHVLWDCLVLPLWDVPSWAKAGGKLTTVTALPLSVDFQPRCLQ